MTHERDDDPASPRGRLLFTVGEVLDALDDLDFMIEGDPLDDLHAIEVELEESPEGSFYELRCSALAERIRKRTREILLRVAEIIPPLASSDPGTPAAMAGFERAFPGEIPTERVMRLMGIAAMPSPLLSLLMHQARLDDLAQFREFAQAAMDLWNRAPRPDLGGRTPEQAAATPKTPRKRPRR
jgi:hypothetical protein